MFFSGSAKVQYPFLISYLCKKTRTYIQLTTGAMLLIERERERERDDEKKKTLKDSKTSQLNKYVSDQTYVKTDRKGTNLLQYNTKIIY